VQQGVLRALAVSSDKRVGSLPNIPTVAETVSPGFNVVPWYGIAAPAGTPAPIVLRLNAEINASLNSASVKERLEQEGAVPAPMSPEQFAGLIGTELKRWDKLIRDAGVTAN